MKLPNKQKGLSTIGWVFAGITLFLYATILTQIAPVYMDDITVSGAIKTLAKTAGLKDQEPSAIISALAKQFDVNNVRDINLQEEGVITITRESGAATIEMNYEKVAPIFKDNSMLQSMDVVIKFKHKAVLK